jgi:hypothetical protein
MRVWFNILIDIFLHRTLVAMVLSDMFAESIEGFKWKSADSAYLSFIWFLVLKFGSFLHGRLP